MMKKRLLALAVIAGLYSANVTAQSVRVENVSPGYFSGMKISHDEQMYCNIVIENNEGGENATLNITFYNNQFMEVRNAQLDAPRGASLLASAFTGEVALVFLGNTDKKTRTIMAIDRHGNMVQRKDEENAPAALLNADNYIGLYTITPTEFISVIATGPKGNELEIERINAAFDPGPKATLKSEKGKMKVEEVRLLNDILFLLCKETSGVNNDKTEYYVKAVNLGEGKLLYSTKFGENAASGLPAKMRVNDDMTVDMHGLLFNEGDMDKTPDGFITMQIDERGTVKKYQPKQWPELLDRSDNKIIKDLSEGKLDLLIEDKFTMPGTETTVLLAEVFEKTNGGAGTASFAVKDFVMFKFSSDGQLSAVKEIEKTPKLATIKGTGATGGKYLVAKSMFDRNFFTYKTVFQSGENMKLMYRYNDGKTDNANMLSISDSVINYKEKGVYALNEDETPEVAKDKKSKKNQEKNIPVVTMEIDLDKQKDLEAYDSFMLLKDNRALVQEYRDRNFTARLIDVPTR